MKKATKPTRNIYRHGDLSLHPAKAVEGKEIKHTGSYVLSEGTATGHKHVLHGDMKIVETPKKETIITLRKPGTVTHEEHRTINVAKGTYMLVFEREHDYFTKATRQVLD